MRINCFDKIKHKEVQSLQDVFFSRVPENTELSEQEQKEIGKEIVMQYYGELNNKINALKQGINPNIPTSEIPDTSGQKKAMEDLYNGLIQKETEGIEQVKKEQDEKSKFQNQTPADQIQIIKAAESEAEAAIISNNPEAAAAAIEKLDYITKSTPEQIAREAGLKEVNGAIVKRQEPVPVVKGKPVNILFAKDKTQEGNYAVIELDDLQPSHKNGIKNEMHFIPEAQPRDRGALEVLKNEAKKKADNLDPAQLADNNIAYFGSPIVNTRGEIIQGNGRGEAVDYYYNNDKTDSKGYRKMVQDKAKELAMDESAVAKMKNPVLVRMVDVNDEEAIRLGNFTSSDLEDVKQKGSEAKAAIGKLKPADMQQLSDTIGSKVGENDTLKSAIRDNAKPIIDLLMDLGVLRSDNREQYFNKDGVTPEGIEAAHNIVKQLLFENGANDLQGKFDNLPFAQREAIEKTIPAILTNPELKSHIQNAIEILHDKQESGTPQFNTWAKQYDMFKGNSPVELYDKADLALARKFDEAKTQKEIASTIKEIAVLMNGKPGDLFSDAQEGVPFNDAMAEKNILFSVQAPTTEEVEDMKDVIADLVDEGTLRLSEIQDYVASELEDNSPEMRDLVATAYHEYGKDKENTPVEVTRGVIGRIGKFLSNLFGGPTGEKIFIAKDSESLRRKARDIGNGIQFSVSMPDGFRKEVKTVNADVVNGFYSPLEKTINETKFDKLPAKQWQEKFAKGDEAKWTGLNDWLSKQTGGISKQQIQDYLKNNRVQIVEVVKGGEGNIIDYDTAPKEVQVLFDKLESGKIRQSEFIQKMRGKGYVVEVDMDGEIESVTKGEVQPTKYQGYLLPGEKTNYKELLVTLPNANQTLPLSVSQASDGKWHVVDSQGEPVGGMYKTREEAQTEVDSKKSNAKPLFTSSHFEEPNILVHLRMNTRIDAEGNKVLFLEEVQSDWGQQGKKSGFANTEQINKLRDEETKLRDLVKNNKGKITADTPDDIYNKIRNENRLLEEQIYAIQTKITDLQGKSTASAPFVTDTNAWTKLGLKVALKEAVKQGADKIAWTTGEQQNDRYDLSKQVDSIDVSKDDTGMYKILAKKNGETTATKFAETPQEIESFIGKDMAEKIVSANIPNGGTKVFSGVDLKVGGKGMKGFYGSPSENSLGIVGNVAKSLFKQEPKTITINYGKNEQLTAFQYDGTQDVSGMPGTDYLEIGDWIVKDPSGFMMAVGGESAAEAIAEFKDAAEGADLKTGQYAESIQHSITITPELKAQVEQGLPLFMSSPDGKILGFTHNNRVYLNGSELNPNTPVHESSHIILSLWNSVVKDVSGKDVDNYINDNFERLSESDIKSKRLEIKCP